MLYQVFNERPAPGEPELHGEYETLDQARAAIWCAGIRYYEIWHGDELLDHQWPDNKEPVLAVPDDVKWPKRFNLRPTATATNRIEGRAVTMTETLALASDDIKRRGIEHARIGEFVSVNNDIYAVRVE